MKIAHKAILIGLGLILLGILIYFISNQKEVLYKQVELNHNKNIVFNQTNKTYYDTILYVGLKELEIEGVVVTVRELSEGAKENFRQQGGDLLAHLRELDGDYYLFISDIDKSDAIKVLSHELIHLKQYYTKEILYANNIIYWKDQKYDLNTISYDDRPWETDAFNKQTELSNKISNILINN